jgi:peptidoglycan/xylan/chitin deacetylase (PgdA/CDA1 family)
MPLLARRAAGAFAALRVLGGRAVRASGAVVFAYHDVDDDPTNATTYLATPDRLRAQLLSVISWGLRFVDLGDLCDRHARDESLDGLAAISFDDGLHGVYRHALPILRELDIPATVFVVADSGSCAQPWPGSRAMTDQEVRALADNGVTIGSHTMSHVSLPGLDTVALRYELADSRARLEDLVQQSVDLLAYPYGHHDPRVRAETRESGYRAACTFLNGRFTSRVDAFRIPRLTMNEQSRARLAYHVSRPAASWPDHQLDVVLDRDDPGPGGVLAAVTTRRRRVSSR